MGTKNLQKYTNHWNRETDWVREIHKHYFLHDNPLQECCRSKSKFKHSKSQHQPIVCVCVCWRIRNEFFNIHLFEFCECDSQTYVQTLTYYDFFFFFFFSQFEFRVLSLTWNTTVIFKLGECARSPIQRITAVVFAYDSYNLVLIDSLLRAQRLSIVRAACVFILDFRSFIDSLIVFFFHF